MRTALTCVRLATLVLLLSARPAWAATFSVASAAELQAALNAAVGGDTVVLTAGITYTGNFVLPVHAGTGFVTIRTSTRDADLPATGTRISPAIARLLPKIQSATTSPALRTAPGAAYWRVQYVEFGPNAKGVGDIIQLGDGSSAQNSLSAVAHHLVLQSVYVHGDRLVGQKRGIALNSGETTIADSYVSDIKAVGIDTQAIGGWNGPGPYYIRNNYLEAAGEVVMFGGDDPKIPDLVPSDIEVRGNTLSKPVAWRAPIIGAPAGVVAVAAAGTLSPGTYGYRVVARRPADSSAIASSSPSVEATVALVEQAGVTLQWTAVPDATEYRIYGRTPGAPDRFWTVAAPATSFTDTGTAGTAGTPAKATVWTVKNLFELKNARRVQVDHNVLEHNWLQAQSGIAIVLTPRNQGGNCPWCVVEEVTLEYNRVRGVAAGVSILGWDDIHPSQQANNIRIRHNEFSDVSKSWGGTGYLFYIIDSPRDVVIDHNTLMSPDGSGVINASGAPTTGFVFSNNLARHNAYGIIGSGYGIGSSSIGYYFPGAVILDNVLAGGKASLYPAGNLFPAITEFEAQFVDYAGGDFTLVSGSPWRNAGTDGADLGAALDGGGAAAALAIDTASLAGGMVGQAYAASIGAHGGASPYRWSLAAGALPAGLTIDAVTGAVNGVPAAAGTSTFVVRVLDAAGTAADQALSISIAAPANTAPVASNATVQAVEDTPAGIALRGTDADGDALVYAVATLPQHGTLTGSAPAVVYTGQRDFFGSDSFTFTVTDGRGATSTGVIAITVANVNDPPVTSAQTPSTTQDTAIAIALVAVDADGDPLTWSAGQPQHGSISGTAPQLTYLPAPGFVGTDTFTYGVSDGTVTVSATITITVTATPSPAITTTSLPDGRVNRAYSATLAVTGGSAPYRWTVAGGQLPPGITVDATTGTMSGKPTTAGTFAFTVRVTDTSGRVADRAFTVQVAGIGRR